MLLLISDKMNFALCLFRLMVSPRVRELLSIRADTTHYKRRLECSSRGVGRTGGQLHCGSNPRDGWAPNLKKGNR
jgi:hypothetical protein